MYFHGVPGTLNLILKLRSSCFWWAADVDKVHTGIRLLWSLESLLKLSSFIK